MLCEDFPKAIHISVCTLAFGMAAAYPETGISCINT